MLRLKDAAFEVHGLLAIVFFQTYPVKTKLNIFFHIPRNKI